MGDARHRVRVVERPDSRSPPGRSAGVPEFTLADEEQAIGELRGTPVLVNNWGSWCGPCREEAPLLSSAHEIYDDRVRFVGVEILDGRDSARAFMREFGWTYPSVYDPTGAIRDGLGLIGQPVTLFYGASGALIDTWSGPPTRDALAERLRRSYAGEVPALGIAWSDS